MRTVRFHERGAIHCCAPFTAEILPRSRSEPPTTTFFLRPSPILRIYQDEDEALVEAHTVLVLLTSILERFVFVECGEVGCIENVGGLCRYRLHGWNRECFTISTYVT